MARRALLALVVFVLVACGSEGEGAGSASPSPTPSFPRGIAIIETDGEPVLLDVEVAQSRRQQELGLMHRKSLPQDAGMVFLYFEPQRGGFWMKNTLIPLSIAFFDEHGEILRILDMEPCRRDPCRVYDPGVSYTGALEVNRGAFERWGVEVGDVLRLQNVS